MKNLDTLLLRASKLMPRKMPDSMTKIEYGGRKLSFQELIQLRKDRRKTKGDNE